MSAKCREFIIFGIIFMILDSTPMWAFYFAYMKCPANAEHNINNTYGLTIDMVGNCMKITIRKIDNLIFIYP